MELDNQSQSGGGSVFIEGHDLPILLEAFLADKDQLTAFFLGLTTPREHLRAAEHAIQNVDRVGVEGYSAVFSALESGQAVRRKLPLAPLNSPSSTSLASSFPSLVSDSSDYVLSSSHHGFLALRPAAVKGPSTAQTNTVFKAGSWSAIPPRKSSQRPAAPGDTDTANPDAESNVRERASRRRPSLFELGSRFAKSSASASAGKAATPRTPALKTFKPNVIHPEINKPDPPIFDSIREVLRDDATYAELIVRAVQHLPDEKQAVLLHTDGDLAATSGPANDDDGNATDTAVQTPASTGADGSSRSNSDKPKKRKASQDRNSGRDKSNGGAGRGPGQGPTHGNPGHEDKRRKSGKNYVCPYCLAFRIAIASNPNFQSCRASVYRKTRNDLRCVQRKAQCASVKNPANSSDDRQHLDRFHSPEAKAKADAKAKAKTKTKVKAEGDDPKTEDNALYYMTEEQWQGVCESIKKAGKKHYALNSKEWLENELKCFLAIWDVLFPAAQFPSLLKPTSPFDSDETEQPSLQQQGTVMFEAIFSVRAQMAVRAGRIASVDEYQPDRSESMQIMSQAFAIVANMDSAVSARIIDRPANELRDAAATGTLNAPPLSDITMTGTAAPSPGTLSLGTSTEPSPTLSLPATPPDPGSTTNIRLDGTLTDIHLRVATVTTDAGQHPVVQVSIPPGTVLQSFQQKRASQESVNQQQMGQQLVDQQLYPGPFDQQSFIYPNNMPIVQMAANGLSPQPSLADTPLLDFGSAMTQISNPMASPLNPATSHPAMHPGDLGDLQNLQLLSNATREPSAAA